MPPKIKISKEEIISTAISIVREKGMAAVNAREIAKRLHCSTQPVFSNYTAMAQLYEDVIQQAKCLYQQSIHQEMGNGRYPAYKASGMAYIRYAKEEKELFRLLFMRDRSEETITEERQEAAEFVELLACRTGLDKETAYFFHLEMWIFVHGIATMVATSYLDWGEETVSQVLTDAYLGLVSRFQQKKEEP